MPAGFAAGEAAGYEKLATGAAGSGDTGAGLACTAAELSERDESSGWEAQATRVNQIMTPA